MLPRFVNAFRKKAVREPSAGRTVRVTRRGLSGGQRASRNAAKARRERPERRPRYRVLRGCRDPGPLVRARGAIGKDLACEGAAAWAREWSACCTSLRRLIGLAVRRGGRPAVPRKIVAVDRGIGRFSAFVHKTRLGEALDTSADVSAWLRGGVPEPAADGVEVLRADAHCRRGRRRDVLEAPCRSEALDVRRRCVGLTIAPPLRSRRKQRELQGRHPALHLDRREVDVVADRPRTVGSVGDHSHRAHALGLPLNGRGGVAPRPRAG